MSKEAMKLAWEAEEKANPQTRYNSWCRGYEAAMREELSKPDFWEGYVPEPVKPEVCCGEYATCLRACTPRGKWLANEALDKKAENARELGLDYEPALQECRCNQGQVCHVCDPILPAQQEYERGFIDGMQEQMRRSVDRAVNAMAQRTWVGLTKEDKWEIVQATERDDRGYVMALVEAKLTEKNT